MRAYWKPENSSAASAESTKLAKALDAYAELQ